MQNIIERLLSSEEPAIRFKTHVNLLGLDKESRMARKIQGEIKESRRVKTLLSQTKGNGRVPPHPYSKWLGAHWILVALADLDYPPGDNHLISLRDQVYEWLFPEDRTLEDFPKDINFFVPVGSAKDRPRLHASMEGNALYSTLKLGIADGRRADALVKRLMTNQWPDGGWNCDRHPKAKISSFHESLIPMRALALYAKIRNNRTSREAVNRAAEIFLTRNMYKRRRDGKAMNAEFTKLHYPCYWHYDLLFGLKVMLEADLIEDSRCEDALTLLKSKQLSDGGFPADGLKYYRSVGSSPVDWGPSGKTSMNEFVTVDALYVLKEGLEPEEKYETILE